MKKLLILFITGFFLFFPQHVFASEGWVIDNFHSDIAIQKSGEVSIRETITVDFGNLQKHGIYRDIPYIYEGDEHKKVHTQLIFTEVSQDGNGLVPNETTKANGIYRVKIGKSSETISGKHTYKIAYTVTGVLKAQDTYDELYWNVTGNYWPVSITSASATITMPDYGIEQLACYQGLQGSKTPCVAEQQSFDKAAFSTVSPLGEKEGMSLVVGYKKGLVPILTVAPEPGSALRDFDANTSFVQLLATFFVTVLAGVGVVMYLWHRNGRDFWRKNSLTHEDSSQISKPIGVYEATVVEFEPPDKLRPAEIGVLMDERADTLDVTATIVDLATRGYLTITEEKKAWIFGSVDYMLKKNKKDASGLLEYESLLLKHIFDDSDSVKISSLKTKFYQELEEVKKKLYENMVKKKFFPSNPEKVRATYVLTGTACIFAGIGFGIFSLQYYGFNKLEAFSLGLAVNGLFFLFMSRFMSRRTATGYALAQRIKGYKLFISQAERYRQQFFEKKNLFNEALPYAIVFGETKKFAKAFKDMGVLPPQPTWYHSTNAFNAYMFSSSINNFSSSFSSAIVATAPKSSGFSSGGGFSGGGFGGGGGGSW